MTSTRPPLNPPPEYVGKFTRWTDPDLRKARREWIIAQARRGYMQREIAAALGLAQNSVAWTLGEAGVYWWLENRHRNGQHLSIKDEERGA